MDFIDQLRQLSAKVIKLKDTIETEEATKNAFIMPFMSTILGYDVFNPSEVVPEYTADIGVKKGEKIDYAIMRNNEVQFLIECKRCSDKLQETHQSQLSRYFHVTNTRIAILTNGIDYLFFTDIDKPNIMDEKPFLEFNLIEIDDNLIPELKKLTKSDFDVDAIVSTAGDLKYLNQITKTIANLFISPSDEFVKLVTNEVYSGVKTKKVIDQFANLTKKALQQFLKDQVNNRISSALDESLNNDIKTIEKEDIQEVEDKNSKIETTEEELEGFYIVKAILRLVLPVERIFYRDTQSYFGVLLDNNNRKPLCRLHFNAAQKYLGIIDKNKKETRHKIETIDDIYEFSNDLIDSVKNYD